MAASSPFIYLIIFIYDIYIHYWGTLECKFQVAFPIERYLVVCHPFYIVSKQWSVHRYIIPLVSFSIIYNLPKFFELDTLVCESNLKQHLEHISQGASLHKVNDSYYIPTDMRMNPHYKQVYLTGMNILFMAIGPFLVLITLNGLTLKNLKQYQQTQRRVSVMPVRYYEIITSHGHSNGSGEAAAKKVHWYSWWLHL